VQHPDRRGNFGASLVNNMVVIYSPDGINVYGSRGKEFEGTGSVRMVESCKDLVCSYRGTSYSLLQTLLL